MPSAEPKTVAIVGGGPAGLMAAERLSSSTTVQVDLYDAMPSLGRKFLMAGKGGLNITHTEPAVSFQRRYGNREAEIAAWLDVFGPDHLRRWAHDLGIETFVGSSGRVFPDGMKAAPLLRAWLHRLRTAGVHIHVRHRLEGLERPAEGADGTSGPLTLKLTSPQGQCHRRVDAAVLALGGGSWARLGSDGRWVEWFEHAGISVAPLQPANCGFDVAWTPHLRERHAGQPIKSIEACFTDHLGQTHRRKGECLITAHGVEGSLIYALSAPLRDTIRANGMVTLSLDLLPDHRLSRVTEAVAHPRGARSLASHLQSRLGLTGAKAALLYECLTRAAIADPAQLAAGIKTLPLRLTAPRPLDEAISSAGGVRFEGLDANLMVRAWPGVFCAGEMLDWEAPTGGYLLTACMASGHAAARGVLDWLDTNPPHSHHTAVTHRGHNGASGAC